jgi:GntR family transcriptional regulator
MPTKIVRDSKLPYYQQLYEMLRGKIMHGEWQPGDMIPSETDLTEQYEVSRITARQALEALVRDGLIYRQRGRGSFVAHQTVEQGLSRIINFTQDMRQRGFEPSTRLLCADLVPSSPDVAEKLDVPPGEELVRIERLRLADSEPMSVEQSFLIHRYCPGILRIDFVANSLREEIDRAYGIRWLRAMQVIRAVDASREMAETLSVRAGSALLFIERVSYSQDDVPVEFLRVYHRGDRYALYNELRG